MMISSRSKNGNLELRKRVPRKYASVEPRAFIWVTLETDSKSTATARADSVWRQHVARWEALLAGETVDVEHQHHAARQLVEAKGFTYKDASELVEQPLEKLMPRVEAVARSKGRPNVQEARAMFGMVPAPRLKISKALEMFWGLTSSDMIGKSADQIRRTRNPVIKAVRNFIDVAGDLDLDEISRDNMLDFRQWWAERMEVEDLTANSANKDLGHLGKVLKRVNELKRLNLDLPLDGLHFKQGEAERRPPFSVEWIQKKLLAKGALAGMNSEARCILLGMVNTGYRPSEGAALLPQHIKLDGTTPHILILPEGRKLKTRNSKRTLPLAGVSLEAMRECKNGFPRYRDKAGLSATINSFLRENSLMESKGHVLYSLRHSFEDRLLAAGVDERIRRDLMGHALDRERYGDGASLEMAHEIIQRIAL